LALLAGLVLCRPVLALDSGDVSIPYDGLSLNGNVTLADSAGAATPMVLLTHGTLAHHRMELVAVLQDLLRERGIGSLAITLSLGISDRHGSFDCAAPHRHKHSDAVDEIGAWLAWLVDQGVARVVLLGHSRGGNQTAWYAAERDDPAIAGVVLVAPMTWNEDRLAASYRRIDAAGLEARRGQARNAAPDDMLEGVGFLYCRDATVQAATFNAYYDPDPQLDTPALLPVIAKPTLVVAGSADTTVPDVAQRTAEYVDDDTQLVVIDGADHFFRDLYADEVVEGMVEFMEGL
jgi:pimeloyl-ACP methyl ester carboxylesterase